MAPRAYYNWKQTPSSGCASTGIPFVPMINSDGTLPTLGDAYAAAPAYK